MVFSPRGNSFTEIQRIAKEVPRCLIFLDEKIRLRSSRRRRRLTGETSEDRKQKIQKTNVIQPATNVIVQPSKMPCENPAPFVDLRQMAPVPAVPAQAAPVQSGLGAEGGPTLTDLLSDVPFTLAPHVLAMQMAPPIPDVLLSRNINDNLASFCYDFALENSVLCDS